ncbi:MAG: nuclear transport factor 2 family protein [Clostridia bacterium]|nr:nuclear transport factor 2 family protein [Clostridia bacterium]
MTSGELNYYSAKHDEIIVTVSGDTATMTGRSKVEAAVYGGGKNTWRLQGDFTLRKENGVWKLTSSRASTY